MIFVRPATQDDFRGLDIEYDYGRYMSDEVKRLIEECDYMDAIKLFKEQAGGYGVYMGVKQAKEYVYKYRQYALAKRDFESGKSVYVSY